MKIVQQNPSKAWRLMVARNSEGDIIDVKTGYANPGQNASWAGRVTALGGTVDEVDNFVFETRMRTLEGVARGQSSVTFQMEDEDPTPRFLYNTETRQWPIGAKGLNSVLVGLQSGRLTIDADGWINGKWTFSKMGSDIYLFPYLK